MRRLTFLFRVNENKTLDCFLFFKENNSESNEILLHVTTNDFNFPSLQSQTYIVHRTILNQTDEGVIDRARNELRFTYRELTNDFRE